MTNVQSTKAKFNEAEESLNLAHSLKLSAIKLNNTKLYNIALEAVEKAQDAFTSAKFDYVIALYTI